MPLHSHSTRRTSKIKIEKNLICKPRVIFPLTDCRITVDNEYMAAFKNSSIASLARQMGFTPAVVRDRQIAAAEDLLSTLERSKHYPLDFITFRITGYDPRHAQPESATGSDLQHDIGLLIETVSETLNHSTSHRTEPVLSIDDLTTRFNVTSKTIQRWRRRGLAARRFTFPDGKRRVGFLLGVVERYVQRHHDDVQRSTRFSQVQEAERQEIFTRARRLATLCNCCIGEISRRIARRLDRSAMTVQAMIRKHDAEHPEQAIFKLASPAMGDEERVQIIGIIRNGGSVSTAAQKVGRPRTTVYRVMLDEHLLRITQRRVKFFDDPLYHDENAGQLLSDMLSGAVLNDAPAVEAVRVPSGLPAYLQALYRVPLLSRNRERALFLNFNYHKFVFVNRRTQLDLRHVRSRQLAELDRLWKRVTDTRNDIARANLRLVVSVARKHIRPGVDMNELVSDGHLTLLRAIESFDAHKGFKFSTYATLALMKGYARAVPLLQAGSAKHIPGHRSVGDAMLSTMPARSTLPDALVAQREHVSTLLANLDDRERWIISNRFGMDVSTTSAPAKVSRLSRERLRQIEHDAMQKLRAAARHDSE
jgi:RNA polymerase primary sigma factor